MKFAVKLTLVAHRCQRQFGALDHPFMCISGQDVIFLVCAGKHRCRVITPCMKPRISFDGKRHVVTVADTDEFRRLGLHLAVVDERHFRPENLHPDRIDMKIVLRLHIFKTLDAADGCPNRVSTCLRGDLRRIRRIISIFRFVFASHAICADCREKCRIAGEKLRFIRLVPIRPVIKRNRKIIVFPLDSQRSGICRDRVICGGIIFIRDDPELFAGGCKRCVFRRIGWQLEQTGFHQCIR